MSLIGMYFAISQDGSIEMKPAWYYALEGDVSNVARMLPRPRVTDLNGDGEAEVILIAWDGSLVLLDANSGSEGTGGFSEVRVLAKVKTTSSLNVPPYAFNVGYLDPAPVEKVRTKRKQVVVAIAADGVVRCFDHNLRLLWERNLEEDPNERPRIGQAAVRITSHANEVGDRGMVVVGWNLETGASIVGEDLFAGQRRILEDTESHGKNADANAKQRSSRVDTSRHFNYIAFEGGTGQVRWQHKGGDFHQNIESGEKGTIPLHNYRLDAHLLQGRHYGEVSCREYKESLVRSLPHKWQTFRDTRLELARFERQKMSSRKQEHASVPRFSHQDSNPVTAALGKAASSMMQGKNGLEKKAPTSLEPNTLVAHFRDGVQAIHLYSGRPICMLHLPSPGLHLDLDGDGVLDHVQVFGRKRAQLPVAAGHAHIQPCSMIVTSGVGKKEVLFNGTVCRKGGLQVDMLSSKYRGVARDTNEIMVAEPAAIPHKDPSQKHVHGTWYRMYDLVFLNSRGEVTLYDPAGRRKWVRQSFVSWSDTRDATGKPLASPTVRAIALRRGLLPEAILVAGSRSGMIMSQRGNKIASFSFPDTPLHPLEVLDFNADGLNDIILCGADGYFGFVQYRHPGGLPFGALLGTMIIAIVVIWMVQMSQEEDTKVRSTDMM